ncbi:DoxX family membrane protein [Allosaccharopolyspora coralli]|uniref:DoxX family membrane protein n=1 Tax=Allosaccharopolyspora coralli TaxID=2665642 RepID=A0A5Q3QBU4_9PSEU|nr:DoxX family protein [Allosaccharopolyspora coralli]QGK68267.1 DoxX family membrane protein [Allosaccharopolyspora coralli]
MLIRRVARPLLASIFIVGGINCLRDVQGHAKAAAPKIDKVTDQAGDALPDELPTDAETLVRVDGAVKVGAGVLLALGKMPRLSALALITSLVPTTVVGHAFWEYEDSAQRDQQKIHFYKNLGLIGGLLLAAVDTEGKPSLAYQARRGGRKVAEQTHDTVDQVKDVASKYTP